MMSIPPYHYFSNNILRAFSYDLNRARAPGQLPACTRIVGFLKSPLPEKSTINIKVNLTYEYDIILYTVDTVS